MPGGSSVHSATSRMTKPLVEPESGATPSEEQIKLQRLTEAAFDGILVHDYEKVLEVNEAGAALFGYTTQEAVGMPLSKFVSTDAFDTILSGARGGRKRHEMLGIRKNGTTFHVELSGAGFGDRGHRVVAVRDISGRKAIEAALIESELRYRELSESSHDLLCEHDLEGRIVSVNPAAARVLETPSEELCRMNIQDLLAPNGRKEFDEYLRTIQEHGVAEGLMALLTPGGERRIWHYRNTLRRTAVAVPIVRGLALDVTDREWAIDALRRSEQHFRSIIEHATDMILIVRPSGEVSYHSPATERLLGHAPRDIDEHPFTELVHEEDRSGVIEFFRTKAGAVPDVQSLDLRLRHADGSWRWFSVVASSRTGHGVVTSIVVNGRDITDRRLLETQLEQATRFTSLGHLTATVAHEFNNVLMGMQPFADLLQRPNIPADLVLKSARHISNSVARGKRITLNMLRFTRPPEPAPVPVGLGDWWERLLPELEASTGNAVRITSEFPRTLTVLADAAQMAQVFSNLVCNARDAMPGGGAIAVRAGRPGADESFTFGVVPNAERYAHIRVEDTGTGMPPEVLRHAFDPLFTTKPSSGTGLGLAVAHQIVSKHGGFIFAESEVGTGTSFHVFLPLAADAPMDTVPDTAARPSVAARRALIVDDEPLIGEGIAEALSDLGIDCTVVENGTDAQAAAVRIKPDVAIIDILLPDIDGLEVGTRLRALDPKLLIVFASGHADATRAISKWAPATFLQKPFHVHELLEAIAALESETGPGTGPAPRS